MRDEDLQEYSIFTLRELARRTGVVSPSSKKKDELIKEILDIRAGVQTPKITKTKQGRPPKSLNYDLMQMTAHNVISENKSIVLNQEKAPFEYQDMTTVCGYIEVYSDSTATLWVEGHMHNVGFDLMIDLLYRYRLRTGDKIVGETFSQGEHTFIKDIYTINDVPITKFVRGKEYHEYEHVPSTNAININGVEAYRGDTVYLYGDDSNMSSRIGASLLSNDETDKKIYVNVSLTEKTKCITQDMKGVDLFTTMITEDDVNIARVIRLAIEHAKSSFEMGEHVVIVVDDLLSISSLNNGMALVKELVALPKNTLSKGSITVLAIQPTEHKILAVERLADRRYSIQNNGIIKM